MTVSSLPVNLSGVKTEFGGPSNLGGYAIGSGYVPKHQNNESATITSLASYAGSSLIFQSSVTSGSGGFFYGFDGVGTTGSGPFGSATLTRIGYGKSTTSQSTTFTYAQGTNGKSATYTSFSVTGNVTGTWWNYVTIAGQAAFYRTGYSTYSTNGATGQYTAGTNSTTWSWSWPSGTQPTESIPPNGGTWTFKLFLT
jgi:hypothetical protein